MEQGTDSIFQVNKTPLPKNKNFPPNKRDTTNPNDTNEVNRKEWKTLSDYWQSAKEFYRARHARGKPELPTGFNFIDELTDGLHKGEVWCVSGRPGAGKTTLAVNIARNIADENKSVLFITLEMTGEQLISRIFSEMMSYDHNLLRIGDFSEDFEAKDQMFTKFLNEIDFEIMEKGFRFQDILDTIETCYVNHKPDLVVLDFVQLIDKEGQDDRQALDAFMQKISELAKTLKMAILIVSQLRRLPSGADLNRKPDITDNRGSGEIEQLSHICLIIYKVIENTLGRKTEKTMIDVAKNRHGPCGEKEVTFVGSHYKFKEVNNEN